MEISAEFGRIIVNGKSYGDVMIFTDGKIKERDRARARRLYGTSHVIDRQEIEELLQGNPEVVFVGRGFSEQARVTEEARKLLESKNIKLVEASTPEAIEEFKQDSEKKAGIFHSTC